MAFSIGGIELFDDGFIWTDEFDWSGVSQAAELDLGGGQLLEESIQLAGRPITLGGDGRSNWATRAQLIALRALAEAAGQTHTLVLPDGREFDVAFRRPAFRAEPVVAYTVGADSDYWALTIYLLTV